MNEVYRKRQLSKHTATYVHLILIFILFVECNNNMTGIHTSNYSLQRCWKKEKTFINILYEYMHIISFHLQTFKDYMEEVYLLVTTKAGNKGESYEFGPSDPFRMIKKMQHRTSSFLKTTFREQKLLGIRKSLLNISDDQFPNINDYFEGCSSLALVQETYDLDIDSIIRGIVSVPSNNGNAITIRTKSKLSCESITHIGISHHMRGWYDSAHLWLLAGLDNCMHEIPEIKNKIIDIYKQNIKVHDQILEISVRKGTRNKNTRTFATSIKNITKKMRTIQGTKPIKDQEIIAKQKMYVPLFLANKTLLSNPTITRYGIRDNFHSLCKDGEKHWRVPSMNRNLTCKYETHYDSYLKLGPFQLEVKNVRPTVLLFHSLISSKQATYLTKKVQ